MVNRTIGQELASLVVARINCIASGNTEWKERHEGRILDLVANELPHGSGIDCDLRFDLDKSSGNRLVIHGEYHLMDENGMYDGWAAFKVKASANLALGLVVEVTGQGFGHNQDSYMDDIAERFRLCLERPACG